VTITCPDCDGHRYSKEADEIRWQGKGQKQSYSLPEILALTVKEALPVFKDYKKIYTKLATLDDLGLGYLSLGEDTPALSGGEAQRIKLSKELSKKATGKTVYILDEPTTGLHFEDIAKLLDVLHQLVEQGNTVVVIEHNLDVIKTADWIIDLGPEGGDGGGKIVAVGTPEQVAECKQSYTGKYLKRYLKK